MNEPKSPRRAELLRMAVVADLVQGMNIAQRLQRVTDAPPLPKERRPDACTVQRRVSFGIYRGGC